ncbi:MAG: patatin-like phospholipase family protein [Desulfuromonadales bacterium]|nr:patatin-like phospholipase family protein [Desulfuromonadales bacterium]
MSLQQQRTAFVFAGGGSLGAIQVGMLKALAAREVRPDLLVGSSVGAINAAYYAADPTSQGVAGLEAIWTSLRREDVFHFSWVGGLKGVLGRRSHLFDADVFSDFIERHLPFTDFAEARVPLHIVASDFISGEEVILSTGEVLPALLASAAIPAIFPPVAIGGRYLVDGGVANHTPVTTAIALGASRLVVLPTGFTCEPEMPPGAALIVALHALNLVIARQLLDDLQHHSGNAMICLVPPLCPQRTHPLDFQAAADLIDQGYQSTLDWLDRGGLEQPTTSFSAAMLHRHLPAPAAAKDA